MLSRVVSHSLFYLRATILRKTFMGTWHKHINVSLFLLFTFWIVTVKCPNDILFLCVCYKRRQQVTEGVIQSYGFFLFPHCPINLYFALCTVLKSTQNLYFSNRKNLILKNEFDKSVHLHVHYMYPLYHHSGQLSNPIFS